MKFAQGAVAGMALAALAGDMLSPGQQRRLEEDFRFSNRRARWRGMINCNESPWVTFRADIKAGKAKLIRRPNKPPLLVAVKPQRGHR